MIREGADFIEIGGESTGPNSKDISVDEELKRTIPVIQAIHKTYPESKLAIDTWKSAVATKAIEAGATMVNDVTAGRGDSEMFSIIADACRGTACCAPTDVRYVLMYSKDSTPRTTIEDRRYDDVVTTIKTFLVSRRNAATNSGVDPERIILDPGLGHFISSDPAYSFEIIARLQEFRLLGCPIFLSPSRKSFLAGPENLPTAERLPGTIAASAAAVLHGASYIRTHDVAAVRRGCEIISMMQT